MITKETHLDLDSLTLTRSKSGTELLNKVQYKGTLILDKWDGRVMSGVVPTKVNISQIRTMVNAIHFEFIVLSNFIEYVNKNMHVLF